MIRDEYSSVFIAGVNVLTGPRPLLVLSGREIYLTGEVTGFLGLHDEVGSATSGMSVVCNSIQVSKLHETHFYHNIS